MQTQMTCYSTNTDILILSTPALRQLAPFASTLTKSDRVKELVTSLKNLNFFFKVKTFPVSALALLQRENTTLTVGINMLWVLIPAAAVIVPFSP